jgi:Cu/Ag efflux protein CusF
MLRRVGCIALIVLTGFAGRVSAQDGPQQARIKKIDTANNTVLLATDAKDLLLHVTPETRLVGADSQELTGRLQAPELKEGALVMFLARKQDDRNILVGMKLRGDQGANPKKGGGEIQRGKIKNLDLDRMILTLTQGAKDRELRLTDTTQVLDAKGSTLKERFQGFKPGDEVYFKPGQRDGKEVLDGIKLVGGTGGDLPRVDTKGLKPLTELGTAAYHGFQGGLYPGGKNERPATHEAAGLAFARQVQPLDADGKPSPEGKIVLLSVGMSNTGQASTGFQKAIAGDRAHLNPHVLFVNGAVGGMTAAKIQDPGNGSGAKYWEIVDQRLKEAGVTRAQVQAIWIKEADAGPSQGFPTYAQTLQAELMRIVQLFPRRFPNARLVYLSGRTYGGYASTKLNPEPYAYESGFSVRWLIEDQLKGNPELNYDATKGPVRAPWLSWGAYLWANGTTKRADGFCYDESDFTANDGTHLTGSGVDKVGRLLLDFFKTDTTTRSWFTRDAKQ